MIISAMLTSGCSEKPKNMEPAHTVAVSKHIDIVCAHLKTNILEGDDVGKCFRNMLWLKQNYLPVVFRRRMQEYKLSLQPQSSISARIVRR